MRSKLYAMLLLALAATGAEAGTCAQADMAGTWRVYGTNSNGDWFRGSLVFSNTGALNAASSSTQDPWQSVQKYKSGQATLASNCRVTGSLTTTYGDVITLTEGWMESGKQTIAGVYGQADIYNYGLVHFVRQ